MHIRQLVAFGLGIFTGSALLFAIQPMFSKMVLPLLGGAPSVWNTLMVFFQAVLLLGYSYAHLSTKILGVKKQSILHMLLLIVSLMALPIVLPETLAVPVENDLPLEWVLLLAASVVGIPFFMLSANAPLMQLWFAHTGHKHREDPYFLYAISNAGSLLSLLSYPFVIQPLFDLMDQTTYWAVFYGLLILFAGISVALMWKDYEDVSEPKGVDEKVTWKQRLSWIVLAAIPSSYLLGVTMFISTDVSAVPLIWVVPLALYLLTFILAFAKRKLFSDAFINKWALVFAVLVVIVTLWNAGEVTATLMVHLLAFFLLTLVCHTRLSKTAPKVSHLTEFYFWISLGGVLGGIFNAIIAPLYFNTTYEYAIALGLATACIVVKKRQFSYFSVLSAIVIALLVSGIVTLMKINLYLGEDLLVFSLPTFTNDEKTVLQMVLVVVFAILLRRRVMALGLSFAGIMAMLLFFPQNFPGHEFTKRSFFGVYRVSYSENDFMFRLWSGNGLSVQGKQSILPNKRNSTLTFYPLEGIKDGLPSKLMDEPMGVIGLGVGTMACLGPNKVDFFEVDPLVKDVAYTDNFFTYLSECEAESEIILGDGRRSIAEQEDKKYGIVVLDAFSSNAIPAHLLTREAFEIYLSKLQDDGVILMNITNQNLDLKPLVAALSKEFGLTVRVREMDVMRRSEWLILARDIKHFGDLLTRYGGIWPQMPPQKTVSPWTDSHSSILPLIIW